MESRIAKIGIVLLVVMVVWRAFISDDTKTDLSILFSSRTTNERLYKTNATSPLVPELLNGAMAFIPSFESFPKQQRVNSGNNSNNNQRNIVITKEEETVPSDYIVSDDLAMFNHLNKNNSTTSLPTNYDLEDENSEPLENYSTINANMALFFPKR